MSLVITCGFASVLLLLVIAIFRVGRKRYRRTEAKAAATLARTLPPAKAALDTEPGFNLSLQDECELIYSMPAYTGEDRLRDAIRNEQPQGDQ